jgi:hypothetical protein
MKTNTTTNVVVQLVMTALIIAGFVLLTVFDKDTDAYVSLVAPVIAAVFVVSHVNIRANRLEELQKSEQPQPGGK